MNSLWSVTAEARTKSCSPKRGWPQVSEPVLFLAAEKSEVRSSQLRSETARESFDAHPAPSLASKNLRCSLLPAELRKACSFGTARSECRLTPMLSTARTTVKNKMLVTFHLQVEIKRTFIVMLSLLQGCHSYKTTAFNTV